MSIEIKKLTGSVERITFYNSENGYSVIRITPDSQQMLPYAHGKFGEQLATVVGNLPVLQPGEFITLEGKWVNSKRHGWQFSAVHCQQSRPATVEGIKRYLGSGMVRGIGPKMAERIVMMFGDATLDIIDEEPDNLNKVIGIGSKRVGKIKQAWNEQRAIRGVMIFLQSHHISTTLAVKIYKQYGDDSIEVVTETPYKLIGDVRGIGFRTADKIACDLGLAHDDPQRIEAGVAYTLNKMAQEGHVYVPQQELEPASAEILSVSAEAVANVIDGLASSELIKRETIIYGNEDNNDSQDQAQTTTFHEERAVYLTPFYYSEIGVTNRVKQLVDHVGSRVKMGINHHELTTWFGKIEQRSGINLAKEQRAAVFTAIEHKVMILTGGPGTGKTTTLRTLLDLLDTIGRNYMLASPTGRAAKRLMEATGREAKTIHRLLEFQPGIGFQKNEESPIDVDMIIIDEASMLDLMLANHLFKAIRRDTHLLLVGDVDQLPSVGAGDVLRDLIASGVPALVRLAVVFRQAEQSLIIQNAHRINAGTMPITGDATADFFIFVKDDPETAAQLLVDVVRQRIPLKFGFDPVNDIQVLCPMYNGQMGVTSLNLKLQTALNPPRKGKLEKVIDGRAYRVGDKVMQVVNNYDKRVFNGDIGRIASLDIVNQQITVNIDGTPVIYDFLELDELIHAYAISVHKSQGSEYPVVIIPMTTQHYMMLQRNLLYTAVTRAKKLVILVGTRKAINIAVRNNKTNHRHTALDWRLERK